MIGQLALYVGMRLAKVSVVNILNTLFLFCICGTDTDPIVQFIIVKPVDPYIWPN